MTLFQPRENYLHAQVGNVPVCWLSNRDRRRLRLHRHLDKHGCDTMNRRDPGYVAGFLHCPQASELWNNLAAEDRRVTAIASPVPLSEKEEKT